MVDKVHQEFQDLKAKKDLKEYQGDMGTEVKWVYVVQQVSLDQTAKLVQREPKEEKEFQEKEDLQESKDRKAI